MIVGFENSDDAGVFRLNSETALVQTLDFFTPVADDPFTYGQVAAINSLNDVYAMGGRPRAALAGAAFPKEDERSVLATIFRGGLDKLAEAGVKVSHQRFDGQIHAFWQMPGVFPAALAAADQAAGELKAAFA